MESTANEKAYNKILKELERQWQKHQKKQRKQKKKK